MQRRRARESLAARFPIEHSNRAVVDSLCVLVRVAHGNGACSSQLAQGAHHVKHQACLALLVEAQIMRDYDVEYSVPMSSDSYGQSTDITVPVPG